MAKRNIRVGIKMSYVDEEGNIADNGDTLYYGEYETDPDEGVRYTYVKTPEGNFDILMTENTKVSEEMINKIVEVGLKDSNNYSPKLTYVLQFDAQDGVNTWNDRIEDLFKKEFSNLYPNLKPTIMQVKSYDIKKAILTPFYGEKTVVVDFELTPGRKTRNVGQLTVELFRRLMDETLKYLDQFLEILNEGFNSLDDLKMVDMKQDEKLGDISSEANSWELICELVRKWISETYDKFKLLHKRYTINLTNYRSNLMCAVRIYSNEDRDRPYIETQMYINKMSLVSILSTCDGRAMDLKINKGNQNIVLPSLNQSSTIRLQGGTEYTVFSSAEKLEYQVMSTENIPTTKLNYNNTRVIPGDCYNPDLHTWVESDKLKNPWHITTKGDPGDHGVIGYVYNYLWRSNNYNSWGAGDDGNNTSCLQQNKDIGEFKNTRVDFTMMMTVSEMRKRFRTITVYTDGWYGLTSMNGSGGIQGFMDVPGRCSYNGVGVWANNEASIPSEKLKVPLRMTNESETSGCAAAITVDLDKLKDDGSWVSVYVSPTNGQWANYSIMHMRRKKRHYGNMKWTYYIRLKNPNTIELLVNYFQYIDGDSGNRVQTQCAGRTSALIVGDKKSTAYLEVKKVYDNSSTIGIIRNDPNADRKAITNVYTNTQYVGFDKTFSYTVNNKDPVMVIGVNCNFIYKNNRDHHGTQRSSYSITQGNLKDFKITPNQSERNDVGTSIPAVSKCAVVDNTDDISVYNTSEIAIAFIPTSNVTNKVLKQITLHGSEGQQYYQLLATITNNGNTRSVRIISRFYGPDRGGRDISRCSFDMCVGVIIMPQSSTVRSQLVSNRPSGRALELYDSKTGTVSYASLVQNIETSFIYGENKQTNVRQDGGDTMSRGWDQNVNHGSSDDIVVGVNCNFTIRKARDHHDTSRSTNWEVAGNLVKFTTREYSMGGRDEGDDIGAQSAPPDLSRETMAGIESCQIVFTIHPSSLTGEYQQIYSKTFAGVITVYFIASAKMNSPTQIAIACRFQLSGLSEGRDKGRMSWYSRYGVAIKASTKTNLSVTDLSNGIDYKLADNYSSIGSMFKSNTMLFTSKNCTMRGNTNVVTPLEVIDVATLRNTTTRSKIGININSSTLVSKPVALRKVEDESSNYIEDGLLTFSQDGKLITISPNCIYVVDRYESAHEYLNSYNSENEVIEDISVENNLPSSLYSDIEFNNDYNPDLINKILVKRPLNSNVIFNNQYSYTNYIDEPRQPTINDIKLGNADVVIDIDNTQLSYLWDRLFSVNVISYITSDIKIKSLLTCFGRVDGKLLQLGWRMETESTSSYNFITSDIIKLSHNILEVDDE